MTVATYIGSAIIVALVMVVFTGIGWMLGGALQYLAHIPDFLPTALSIVGAIVGVRLIRNAFGEV